MAQRKQSGGGRHGKPTKTTLENTTALEAAREQQAATAEILRLIATSPDDAQPVFHAIARHALLLCGGVTALVVRYDGELLYLVAHENLAPDRVERVVEQFPRPPAPTIPLGVAVLEGAVVNIRDLQSDLRFTSSAATQAGFRSVIAIPLMKRGQAIGALGVSNREGGGFSDDAVTLLQTFADQAVIAIENARLFAELRTRNLDLAESLERQTATSDILRVISGSPAEVAPVFAAVVASAARLCGANDVAVLLVDGDDLRIAGGVGPLYESLQADFRFRMTRGS